MTANGHFYLSGPDLEKVGPMFNEWIKSLPEDVKATSYNYAFYLSESETKEQVRKEDTLATKKK